MLRPMVCALNLVALAAWLCLHTLEVSADQDVHSDGLTLEWKQIFVDVLGGPSFSLMVEPDQTGMDLMWDIYKVEGIYDSPMTPMVGDIMVDSSKRLSDYNISDQTILTVDILDETRSNMSIEFHVRTLDGRKLPVTTKLGNSVASLKDNITQWTGIPQIEQRLLCNGKELRDERKLLHYKVENGTTLNLGRPLKDCHRIATISVKTLSGATIGVEVDLADTVSDLKDKIYRKTGIPVGVQRLSTNGRMITGVDHLCDLGPEAGSTVQMYLYSARIESLDQVAKLRESQVTYPVSNHRAPIFREVEDVGESVQSDSARSASLYKDVRNWVTRSGHRPFFANELFDQVAHLSPNPDDDASIQSDHHFLNTLSRPNASESDRLRLALLRAHLNLSMAIRPFREAANLTSTNYTKPSPGITLGGGFSNVGPQQLVPLGADVNNWAPDAFSDSSVMRLFEVAERVRQVLARAAQTGKGILSIASQKQINREILLSYHQALAGNRLAVEYKPAGEGEECRICRDDLTAEPAIKLFCEHAYHADCLLQWASDLIKQARAASCPYCKENFFLPYEALGKVQLALTELQDKKSENGSVSTD